MICNSSKDWDCKMLKRQIVCFCLVLVCISPVFASSWNKKDPLNTLKITPNLEKNRLSPYNFKDEFNYKNIEELDEIYELAFEWKKGKYPKDNYELIEEKSGNKFIAITVKPNTNSHYDAYGDLKERGEINLPKVDLLEKEVWYGFRVRFPEGFEYNNSKYLKIHQLMDATEKAKQRSPRVSFNIRNSGNRFQINGQFADLKSDPNKNCLKEDGCYEKAFYGLNYDKSVYGVVVRKTNNKKASGSSDFKFPSKGKWQIFKVGTFISRSDDGFVKIYQDDKQIFDYSGVTYDRKLKYYGTLLVIGGYRYGTKTNGGFPPQTIHFDDLTVVSSKEMLDKQLISAK